MHKQHLEMLALVGMVVICSISAAPSAAIKQMFPENVDYCCHCPNIKLKCNFSESPLIASWAVVNGKDNELVTTSTPGHTVDTSEIQSGTLYLEVNSTVYSEGNSYSCTAVYPDGETEVADSFLIPMVENLSAPFRTLHIKPIWNTLHVQWKHDYYLCRNFTIYLDDTAVPECTNITALNCTIRNLNDGVQYEVKVAATELDTKPVTISQNVTTLDSRSAGASVGVCIWLLFVVTLAQELIVLW